MQVQRMRSKRQGRNSSTRSQSISAPASKSRIIWRQSMSIQTFRLSWKLCIGWRCQTSAAIIVHLSNSCWLRQSLQIVLQRRWTLRSGRPRPIRFWSQVFADRAVKLSEFHRHSRQLHGRCDTRFKILGGKAGKPRGGHGLSPCLLREARRNYFQRALDQFTRTGRLRSPNAMSNTPSMHSKGAWMLAFTRRSAMVWQALGARRVVMF